MKFLVISALWLVSLIFSSSRVVYTRPGLMMRIPTSSTLPTPYLFRTGFGIELHNFDPMNSAKGVYFDMSLGKGFSAGFSAVQGGDTTSLSKISESQFSEQVEFGFHFQQKLFVYNDISLSAGLQDIVFQNNQSDEQILSLDTDLLSFFIVLSSEKDLGDYKMATYMGFGTGGLGPMDSTKITIKDSTEQGGAGVFVGFLLKTPYFSKSGGMDIMGEFDGTGVNVGLRIPLTSDYSLNLGFAHIERLPDWKTRYWNGHPAFTLGFDMAIPRINQMANRKPGGPLSRNNSMLDQSNATSTIYLDSTVALADFTVLSLRDSMSMMNNEMRNLMVQLNSLEQQSQFLDDSLKSLKLDRSILDKNMNEAMRHLSRSLRYFYAGDFRESLKEVDMALDLQPDLALAYARRGSIYYKLGDVQRATINWNLALRLDPEYDDVRNILKALHENRLKNASMFEE